MKGLLGMKQSHTALAKALAIATRGFALLLLCATVGAGHGSYAQPTESGVLREGSHMLTLHWISWGDLKRAGKAQVHLKGVDLYSVKGEQRGKDGKSFVTIDGTLKATSPTELLFDGTIRTQSSDANQGNVCEKTGTYHFVAKAGKKYWRLQEMDDCDKVVVDYVDIYF